MKGQTLITDPFSPVVLYHPGAHRLDRRQLYGRHSAGENFLTAFLEQTEGPDVFALCESRAHFAAFTRAVAASGRHDLVPRHVRRTDIQTLGSRGLVHIPDPDIADEARIRNFLRDDLYSVCGLHHSLPSYDIIEGIQAMCVAPVMPWDALICTSRASHAVIRRIIDNAEDNLRRRLGARRFHRPMTPVIPLAVHTRRFQHDERARRRWRRQLGIAEETIAVLYFGRLSVHNKASPFQLAQAMELAARAGRTRFELILCGWFESPLHRRAFLSVAQGMAPSVRFHQVDGRKPDARSSLWSAADIFCSLSDNIQETFGLTVIEAMAAGLPVVASNWDGYREAVTHGVNGILIDTWMPPVSLADAGYRYFSRVDDYGQFVGGVSQFCVVDLGQVADWLVRLGTDRSLRRRIGAAASRHAAYGFDWKAVFPRYQKLWRKQATFLAAARRRGLVEPLTNWKSYDPAFSFAGFPSKRPDSSIVVSKGPHFERWNQLVTSDGIVLNASVLARRSEFRALRDAIAKSDPISLKRLITTFHVDVRDTVVRTVYWAVKVGLLQFKLKSD
jgi:alpha-maltose-1-phosphate synthase